MLTPYVVTPVFIAAFLFVAAGNKAVRILAILFQSILFAASFYLVMATRYGAVETVIGGYESVLGIVLRACTLSSVFVLLTTFIFLAASIYTLTEQQDKRSFWFLLFLLESALIGLFLTGDLFNAFVLVEVSTLVIVILTMYDRKKRNMFSGKVFLMTNIVAIQFYLLGIGYIYRLTGVLDIIRVTETLARLSPESLTLPYVLIMTAIAFKCLLIPFFSWSPKVNIYPNAPTAVAAILSALQIKAAVYLFLQFQDIFQPIAAMEFFLVIGVIVGLFGAFMAICQTNIMMILAYHTVSQVGLIIIGASSGSFHSYLGSLYHIISHAMFKTTLFLCAGNFILTYGTSDIYKIRGVMKRMPLVGTAAAAAVLGITGAPFFIGSISKYFIAYDPPLWLEISLILISLGTIISFIKFSTAFFGTADLDDDAPSLEVRRVVPVLIMGAICFLGGIFGPQLIYFLFRYEITVDAWGYFRKSLIFAASVGTGLATYKYIVSGNTTLKRIGSINFSFKTVCASMGVFFAVLLVYVGFIAA